MTTKQAKATKPATRPAFNAKTLAHEVAEAILNISGAQAIVDTNCQLLHKKGIKVGTLKSDCAVMAEFVQTLEQGGKAEQTVKNYATAFRKAVNEGKPFSMNAYRKSASKGAQSTSSEEEKPAVKLTIRKDAEAFDVAEGLRQAINEEKFRESYAELAAFLTDALDEFQGK